MIRVLLVDDSPLALQLMQRLLGLAGDIRVVGTARDGHEALPLAATLRPDVVCIDLHMPVMDGLEFTRILMATNPLPILVISVSVAPGTPSVFRLLEAGAVDVLPKPRLLEDADQGRLAAELIDKVRIVAGVRVFRHPSRHAVVRPAPQALPAVAFRRPPKLAVIGASTGGPQALHEILAALPADFPLPLVCVQHIGREFLGEMLAWLADVTPLAIRKAVGGQRLEAGTAYFAPEDAHLVFDEEGRLAISHAPPCDGHRPSVTVTMEAAARRFGAAAVGVLLTGMGRDGAEGMASIAAAGGVTIGQDAASSVVFGMPAEAAALGAVQHQLPLAQIAQALKSLAKPD